MKRALVLVTILTFCMSLSCDNEPYEGPFPQSDLPGFDNSSTIPDDFENIFFAKLNGLDFNVQNIYTINSIDIDENDFIAITGSENNYHSIILYLPSDISIGTYYCSPQTILPVPNLNVTYSNLADLVQSGIGDGQIIIESHDIAEHYIKGNFQCDVNSQNGNVQYITEGRFEVIY